MRLKRKNTERKREEQGNGGICLRAWCDVGRVREGERLGGKRGVHLLSSSRRKEEEK